MGTASRYTTVVTALREASEEELETMRVKSRSIGLRAVMVMAITALVLSACGGTEPASDEAADPGATGDPTGDDSTVDEESQETIPVRYTIGLSRLPSASAYYSSLPVALGFFEEEGLDVEINLADGGNAAAQAMAGGRADVTLTASSAVYGAINQDMKAKMFCSLLTSTHVMPAAPVDSDVESLEDFRGKSVGVPSVANAATTVLRAALAEVGVDPDTDVSIIPIGTGADAATAIERGNVQALSMVDSHYAGLENQGLEFNYFITPLLEKLVFNQVLTATDEWAEKYPEGPAKFGRAVAKATLYAQENPEESIKIHWEEYPESQPTGEDEETALEEAMHVFTTRVDKTELEEGQKWCDAETESVQATGDFLADQGVIEQVLDVDQYWTDQYVEEINNFDEQSVLEN